MFFSPGGAEIKNRRYVMRSQGVRQSEWVWVRSSCRASGECTAQSTEFTDSHIHRNRMQSAAQELCWDLGDLGFALRARTRLDSHLRVLRVFSLSSEQGWQIEAAWWSMHARTCYIPSSEEKYETPSKGEETNSSTAGACTDEKIYARGERPGGEGEKYSFPFLLFAAR